MKITFLGASKTVTGSCYLVETGKVKFLIDCGMFQGPDVENMNSNAFKFNPQELDFVILTHSHIDHSGLLPKLIKYGFRNKIYLTGPTARITELLLLDAAKIQEDNYRRGFIQETLYDTEHAKNTINKFISIPFHQVMISDSGIEFKLIRAGHILGAASVLVKVENKLIVFSGDLGREDQSIIKSFAKDNWYLHEKNEEIDAIIMESLYAGEEHGDRYQEIKEIEQIINQNTERNGIVMIPSFALHRTQEMILILRSAIENSHIKDNVQINLDTPLGNLITKVYTEEKGEYDVTNSYNKFLNIETANDMFSFDNLKIINHHRQSLSLDKKRNSIIIAGSGMADGGRILQHIYALGRSPSNSIIFVGFQAQGTHGRELTEGQREITINNTKLRIKSHIYNFTSFSAHAGNNDLHEWLKSIPKKITTNIFLVHAEPERLLIFQKIIKDGFGYNTIVPELGSIHEI
ncbi:MAG: MBL fold metallo-hydrolase [bacterium]